MLKKGVVIEYDSKYQFIDRSKWGFGSSSRFVKTKIKSTGQFVFLKENDSPTYPASSDTEKTRQILIEHCRLYEDHRIAVINTIDKAISKYQPTLKTTIGNIVNVVDFFRNSSTNRFMEVIPFVDNIERKKKIVDFKYDEKISILKTIIYALNQIHDVGIVHSDIKPERIVKDGKFIDGNIILVKVPFSRKYTAKLIDFDSSYFEKFENNNDYTYNYCIKGTNGYLSPELIEFKDYIDDNDEYSPKLAKNLSTKSDIFTMGIIFHEYLTGKWPKAPGNMTVGHAVLTDKEIEIDSTLSTPFKELILLMLNKDYNSRPTALEVFEVLKDAKALKNISGKPSTTATIEDTWPEDGLVLIADKIAELGGIKKGKIKGQYMVGKGFHLQIKTAAELVNQGLALHKTPAIDKPTETTISSADIKPATPKKPAICEPWVEDNIIFVPKKINRDNVSINRTKQTGKYLVGTGFKAIILTTQELIKAGYAKKKS